MMSIDDALEKAKQQMEERNATQPRVRTYTVDDFLFDTKQDQFWCIPLNDLRTSEGVDALIPQSEWTAIEEPGDPEPEEGEKRKVGRPRKARKRLIKPSEQIKRTRSLVVESSYWWPGQPRILQDYGVNEDGLLAEKDSRLFNTFRQFPDLGPGNAGEAGPWIEHVKRLWPEEAAQNFFFDYCAHMVQKPGVKCHGAVVMSGTQGIGKDTALEPLKRIVGDHNYKGIGPNDVTRQYNPWCRSVMVVVNEMKPTDEDKHASQIYNALKEYLVAPPHDIGLREKYLKTQKVRNVLRMFITTNDLFDMFIPADDRRMFIMHSRIERTDFPEEYFPNLYQWIENGGAAHVKAFLMNRDLSAFNPAKEPPKTDGFGAVVGSWQTPYDHINRVLEATGRPPVILSCEFVSDEHAGVDMDGSVEAVKRLFASNRLTTHRMVREGYEIVRREGPYKQRWGAGKQRSSYAFVRSDMGGLPPAAIHQMIHDRAAALHAREKSGKLEVVPK